LLKELLLAGPADRPRGAPTEFRALFPFRPISLPGADGSACGEKAYKAREMKKAC